MTEPELQLPPLERIGTVDRAVQVIREGIIQGTIIPGTQLKVATLARQLGTSHGSVREAIRVLSAEYLVEYRHNRGAIVREFSSADMVNVYAAREAVERWAVACIIEAPKKFDLTGVRAALKRMKSASDFDAAIQADMDFHRSLVKAAGNHRLHDFHSSLMAESEMLLRLYRPFPVDSFYEIHRDTLDAITSGDPMAIDLLISQFRSTSSLIHSRQGESGDEFESGEESTEE